MDAVFNDNIIDNNELIFNQNCANEPIIHNLRSISGSNHDDIGLGMSLLE